MKTLTKRLAVVMMVVFVLMQTLFVIPALADAEGNVATNVKDARKATVVVNLLYTHQEDKKDYVLKSETGFFIDKTYVLTCNHGVNLDADDVAYFSEIFGESFATNYNGNLKYQIVIDRDVTVPASLSSAKSESYDFAVLKLSESVQNITVLPLGTNDMIEINGDINCLGFPAWTISNASDLFKAEDVTVTDGTIAKEVQVDGTDLFMHSASVSSGSSGGPTILEDGTVIGIVKAVSNGEVRYSYSIKIDSVRDILDKFGIPYVKADATSDTPDVCDHEYGEAVVEDCVPTYTCTKCGETKSDPANHSFGDWTVSKEATSDAAGEEKKTCSECGYEEVREIAKLPETKKDNTLLIVIAVVAVLIVAVVVVIIIIVAASSKKKAAPAPAPAARPAPAPAPVGVGAPQRPVAPAAPSFVPPVNDGAGNTTVLNEGAGETTVLGGGAAAGGASLIRTKNGERIAITGNEFVIGKEKRRVNYCIADNNSISRAHAKIVRRGNSSYIVDMNSTNFTFVNGTKLSSGQEHLLNNGDKIKLSDEEFQFQA